MTRKLNIDKAYNDTTDRRPAGNRGLNAMGADVLNSTFILLFGICAKLNICASNPPLRQAPNRWWQG